MARKVKKWYDETQGKSQDLQYRFTGKDSKLLCHNFMRLTKSESKGCVSLFSRFDITIEQVTKLSISAREYYRVNALFLPTSVNPTVWTIGHIIPAHTKQLHYKYGQGLDIVTMEGREANHIVLKKLTENTFYKRCWYEIFKHEFVMLVWLPEQGFNIQAYCCIHPR